MGVTNPQGEEFFIAAAFPSACGKTNMAMLNPNLPGWSVRCVGMYIQNLIPWFYSLAHLLNLLLALSMSANFKVYPGAVFSVIQYRVNFDVNSEGGIKLWCWLSDWKMSVLETACFWSGDDIAWMKFNDKGELRGINPEYGFFGVAPGTNWKTNPNAMAACQKNTIFTNVGKTADGMYYWEGLEDELPDVR